MGYEFIHDGAREKRIEPAADVEIGLEPAGAFLDDKSQRMHPTSLDDIAHIGAEGHDLIVARTRYIHLDGHERRVLDTDAEFFHRCYEIGLAVLVPAQDGREQPHQRLASDRRAQIVPGAVGADFHVDVAAEVRIPPFHGRKAAVSGRSACDEGFEPCTVPSRLLRFRHLLRL